ncbi:MAG TPA: substrate-binding domain-containing protein [Vicinamibacterales bacterium]|nr:substrate-binding domain-containing protein [Vicinamibacterales bacterium]
MRAYLASLILLAASPAAAQSLTVLSSNATKALIEELAPQYEKATGQKVAVRFDNSAALRARIEKGETFDVAVLTTSVVSDLAVAGKLAADSRVDIARAGVGMAIHPLATKPDISSLDTLKGALITARSITYVEQGATASILRSIFAKLGLTELMNAKTVYSDSAAHAVAEKKAELGFTQISEILNVPGAMFAAPLPPEVQVYTTFAAAISAGSTSADAAKRFIAYISGPQAANVIKRKGMETVPVDRLPPIAAAQLTPAQREAVDAFTAARGTEISGPFYPLLRSPELMTRTRAMGDYLRYKSALPPRLSEFVILLTAREWTQQYEWNAHFPIAVKAGVKREILEAIAEGRRPGNMSDEETILYAFCHELNHDRAVSDATYARALKAFGEQGVVDTIGITGYYTLLAMTLNTARTPAGETGSPLLRPVQR